MKDYRSYTVEELATDALFQSWVTNPTPETTSFWIEWIAANQDRATDVNLARDLVLAVREMYGDELSDEMIEHEVHEISRLASQRQDKGNPFWPTSRPLWRVAAVLILISSIGLWLFNAQNRRESNVSQHVQTATSEAFIIQKNNAAKELTVLLSDNSVATLAPGSTIRYPRRFTGKARIVTLTGEAFFDVANNP